MYSERGYDQRNRNSGGRGFGNYSRSNFGRNNRSYENDRGYDGGYNGGFDDRRNKGGRGGSGGRTYNDYNSFDGHSNAGRGQGPRGGGGRGRGYWGNRGRGRGRGDKTFRDLPEGIEFLTVLKGHKQTVTAMCLDVESKTLYTGARDGQVRKINCDVGQCEVSEDMGGPVDSLLFEAGYLCVGCQGPNQQGLIRVWNTATGQSFVLEGHQGEVLSLSAANGMLFSGGKDKSIRVWSLDPTSGVFVAQAVLTAAQGGHKAPVQTMVPIGNFLFSADWQGTLKVWDLTTGQCSQTILSAHQNTIMAMLSWEGHLVTAGLDGLIRVWSPLETPVRGAVLESAPNYTHPPDDDYGPGQAGGKRGLGAAAVASLGGILAMTGTVDPDGKPILVTSHNDDACIRLWELPTFIERGTINEQQEVRAVKQGPAGLIIAGNRYGDVRIWRWKQPMGGEGPGAGSWGGDGALDM